MVRPDPLAATGAIGPVAAPDRVPLASRAPGAVMFRRDGKHFTAADFLADAARLADALPEARHVVNLCRDRYGFAVALAAAVIRDQVSLLTSDRSPARLQTLAESVGGAGSISDDPTEQSPLRHSLVTVEGADAAAPKVPLIPADRLAAIVFTSGSTGEPVGNRKSWGTLAQRSAAAGLRFRLAAPGASVVGTVPPQHMYGFETTLLLPLHAEASSWCGPAFYPYDVQHALAQVPAPRVLVTTPLQIRALLQAEIDLPSMARVISATAPLDALLAAEAERRWGTQVFEIFGATEVGSIASRRTVGGDIWETYPGVSLPDAESGTLVGEGLRVAAPHHETRVLTDVIEAIDGSHFRLIGRGGDIIKMGGRRASLSGLNRLLNGISGVRDGAFLVPDDLDRRPTARLLAFVVAPDRAADEILTELRARIDPVFLPRRVVRVDTLPRNEVGKLPREALVALQASLSGENA